MTSTEQDPGRTDPPSERLEKVGKDVYETARDKARSQVERGKASVSDSAGRTSEALDETSAKLSSEGRETLAEGTRFLSNSLSRLADQLEHRSVDDLTVEARRLARNNPTLFTAGGVALGLALSRFFKASGNEETGARSSTTPTTRDEASGHE